MKRIVVFFVLVLLVGAFVPQLTVITLKKTALEENRQIVLHSETGSRLCSSSTPPFSDVPAETTLNTSMRAASAQLSEAHVGSFALRDSQVSEPVGALVPALTNLNGNERENDPAVIVNNGSDVAPLWGEYHAEISDVGLYFTRSDAYEQDTCYITVRVHNNDAGFFGADLYVNYTFYCPDTTFVGFQTSVKHYVYRGTDYTFPTLEIPIGSFYLRYTGPELSSKVVPELWWDDSGDQRLQDDDDSVSFPVLDEDTSGPNIYNVQTAEYNGDNDGILEDDEQVKISWSLTDPSGIYETKCSVDGSWQPIQGNYYVVCGPLGLGSHLYKVYATDNDNDPYHDGDRSSSDTGFSPLSFSVTDDDAQGPAIQNVQVSEHNGNGDGIIRNNEQVKISWSLSDPSGIYSRSCRVNGVSYPIQDGYYTICGPLEAGIHYFEISATDDDADRPNDQASNSYTDSFEVHKILELGVIHQVQRKDTYLLSVGWGTSGEAYSGQLAWDRPHPTTLNHSTGSVLDDFYCARASVSMIVSYFGGALSQDRISYYYFEERPDAGNDLPEGDLGEGSGMWGQYVLGWALNGASITPHTGKPPFSDVKQWIDANRPIYISYVYDDGGIEKRHAMVIDGYNTYGKKVHILDPWEIAGTGLDKVWLPYNLFETAYGTLEDAWIPAACAVGRNDEPTVWADSDGDGVYDFDEVNRFHTDPDRVDTDSDGISDKQEIISYTFLPNQNYDSDDQRKPDLDSDDLRAELDEDSDGGGVHDGSEDKNGNGFYEPTLGETDPLKSSDDPNTVHLESAQDNNASVNLGTIEFAGLVYTLPNDITKAAGTYSLKYSEAMGYVFDHWEVTTGAAVADANARSTIATITGSGTLRAIYKALLPLHLESVQGNAASANLGITVFDDLAHSLPNDTLVTTGTYFVEYVAARGYAFSQWETVDGVVAADPEQQSTTITIISGGTLRAIYELKRLHGYSNIMVRSHSSEASSNLTHGILSGYPSSHLFLAGLPSFFKIKKGRRTVIIVACILVFAAILSAAAFLINSGLIFSHGVVYYPSTQVYRDRECTTTASSIDWGLVAKGSSSSTTLYLRNRGDVCCALSLETSSWRPTLEISTYVNLEWNCSGTLDPGTVANVAFNLTMSESESFLEYLESSNTEDFAFDIAVNESEA